MRLARGYHPIAGNVADADALMAELQRYEAKLAQVSQHQVKDAGTIYSSFVDGSGDPRPLKYWHNQTALLRASGPASQALSATLRPDFWQIVDDAAGDPLVLTFTVFAEMWFSIWASAGYTNAGGLWALADLRVTINGQPGDAKAGGNCNGTATTPTTNLYLEETRLLGPGTYAIGAQVRERGNFGGGGLNYATLIALGLAR